MESNRNLIAAAYAAFNNRDIDAALALMNPAVDWPNGMEGGRVVGHEEVRKYWTRQWKQIDPHVEPVDIREAEGGEVVVEVHQVIRDLAGSVLMDQTVWHIFLVEDHLITSMDIRSSVTETDIEAI